MSLWAYVDDVICSWLFVVWWGCVRCFRCVLRCRWLGVTVPRLVFGLGMVVGLSLFVWFTCLRCRSAMGCRVVWCRRRVGLGVATFGVDWVTIWRYFVIW